jgi:glutathione peroxidase-family protein
MTEIEKEITLKAHEACKKHDSSAYYRYGYHDGAKWMYEKMQETNEGQALLYAVEKTAKRTKREVIEKAVKWMYNYFVIDHYGMTNAGFGLFELAFKQAMQDESK